MIHFEDAVREARIQPRLAGRPLAVGDLVELRVADDDVVIIKILPRRTSLERSAGQDGPRRLIAANADVLMIVESLTRPDPRPHLIDRYLVAAWVGGLDAAVVLTKADLAPQAGQALHDLYAGIGYDVFVGSAKDPTFAQELRTYIGDRAAALVGQSGVGKSTLTSWLTGVARTVGEVSDRDGTGRHTTSDPLLIPLEGGGAIIDTAGVRSLFLPPLQADEVADAFPEVRAIQGQCRFRDCRHMGETGCALPGKIAETRFESYKWFVENP
jgi:ribosome biogenesis GTPase